MFNSLRARILLEMKKALNQIVIKNPQYFNEIIEPYGEKQEDYFSTSVSYGRRQFFYTLNHVENFMKQNQNLSEMAFSVTYKLRGNSKQCTLVDLTMMTNLISKDPFNEPGQLADNLLYNGYYYLAQPTEHLTIKNLVPFVIIPDQDKKPPMRVATLGFLLYDNYLMSYKHKRAYKRQVISQRLDYIFRQTLSDYSGKIQIVKLLETLQKMMAETNPLNEDLESQLQIQAILSSCQQLDSWQIQKVLQVYNHYYKCDKFYQNPAQAWPAIDNLYIPNFKEERHPPLQTPLQRGGRHPHLQKGGALKGSVLTPDPLLNETYGWTPDPNSTYQPADAASVAAVSTDDTTSGDGDASPLSPRAAESSEYDASPSPSSGTAESSDYDASPSPSSGTADSSEYDDASPSPGMADSSEYSLENDASPSSETLDNDGSDGDGDGDNDSDVIDGSSESSFNSEDEEDVEDTDEEDVLSNSSSNDEDQSEITSPIPFSESGVATPVFSKAAKPKARQNAEFYRDYPVDTYDDCIGDHQETWLDRWFQTFGPESGIPISPSNATLGNTTLGGPGRGFGRGQGRGRGAGRGLGRGRGRGDPSPSEMSSLSPSPSTTNAKFYKKPYTPYPYPGRGRGRGAGDEIGSSGMSPSDTSSLAPSPAPVYTKFYKKPYTPYPGRGRGRGRGAGDEMASSGMSPSDTSSLAPTPTYAKPYVPNPGRGRGRGRGSNAGDETASSGKPYVPNPGRGRGRGRGRGDNGS